MDSTSYAPTAPTPEPASAAGPLGRERRANPGDEKTIDPGERRRRALEAILELDRGR